LTRAQQNNDSHYFEHDATALLAMDRKTLAEIYAIESANGATSPDEYRAATNRNPRPDGEGGRFYQPNANYVPVEESSDNSEQQTETDNQTMAILNAVLSEQVLSWKAGSIAVIKKECRRKAIGKFSNWLNNFDGLKVPEKLEERTKKAGVDFNPSNWIENVKREIANNVSDVMSDDWQNEIITICEGFENV
jgi:hypothetical protein